MKQKTLKKIMVWAAVLLAVNLVFSFAAPVLAVDNSDIYWGGNSERQYVKNNSGLPAEVEDPRAVVVDVIRVVLGFLGILAVIIILFAGFKWMTAGGNDDKVSEAKKMLTAGLIGLVIILSAYAVASFVIDQIYNATTT